MPCYNMTYCNIRLKPKYGPPQKLPRPSRPALPPGMAGWALTAQECWGSYYCGSPCMNVLKSLQHIIQAPISALVVLRLDSRSYVRSAASPGRMIVPGLSFLAWHHDCSYDLSGPTGCGLKVCSTLHETESGQIRVRVPDHYAAHLDSIVIYNLMPKLQCPPRSLLPSADRASALRGLSGIDLQVEFVDTAAFCRAAAAVSRTFFRRSSDQRSTEGQLRFDGV